MDIYHPARNVKIIYHSEDDLKELQGNGDAILLQILQDRVRPMYIYPVISERLSAWPWPFGQTHSAFIFIYPLLKQHNLFIRKNNRYPNRMKLTDFPSEILYNILSNIPRKSELVNVALVSPLLKALAESLIYKDICFEIPHTTASQHPDHTLLSHQKPDRLLETLIVRPHLGEEIVALSLDVHERGWCLQFPLCKLLERLPKLRELSLMPPTMIWTPLVPLHCLTSVQLDFGRFLFDDAGQEDTWCIAVAAGIALRNIASFMSLPSLRRVQAKTIHLAPGCNFQQYLDRTQEQDGGSSVVDLRFLDCDAYGPGGDGLVARFISSVKRLKRFVFEMKGVSELYKAEEFIAIGRALISHYDSLEELVLAESDTLLFTKWAVGNLKDSSTIRRLGISIHTTFVDLDTGSNFEKYPSLQNYIPPQLEELQLQFPVCVAKPDEWAEWAYWPGGMQDAATEAKISYREGLLRMWELTQNKNAHVPGLKRVICWFQQSSQDPSDISRVPAYGSLSDMDELRHAFGKVEVEFEWIATPFFRDTPFGQRMYKW